MSGWDAFRRRVQELGAAEGIDLQRRDRAEAVSASVLQALHEELSGSEARAVARGLPHELERLWVEPWETSWLQQLVAGWRQGGGLDREAFFARVQHGLGSIEAMLVRPEEVPGLVAAVFTALREHLPAPLVDTVARALPATLRDLWEGGARVADVISTHLAMSAEGAAGEVPKGEWLPFLAGLSAHYQTSPVRITIEQRDGRTLELVSHMPLIGMEPEMAAEGVRAIDVVVGETGGRHPEHLLHRAEHPARLLLQVNEAGYARALDIEGEDGTRTLIRFAA
jgi:uncharacterized protein (DUF2267 family)